MEIEVVFIFCGFLVQFNIYIIVDVCTLKCRKGDQVSVEFIGEFTVG